MKTRRLDDPADFLETAGPLLLADEARHNLILGLAGTLRDRPGYYERFHLWLVEDGRRVVAAALQTPPFNLVLARPTTDRALAELAEALARQGLELPGVVAAFPEAEVFADAWKTHRGVERALRRGQRIYLLTEVRRPADVPGRARAATQADHELLVDWVGAFANESFSGEPSPASDAARVVDGRLDDANGGFLLWEDGAAVSLAGFGAPTPNGIRIGPVYTPPGHRGRGYGSAVTAAVSAHQLSAGRQFCFLYTDLANPTSNKIYMDIGYEPVCDSVEYGFAS